MKSKFNGDKKKEELYSLWLDKYFYDTFAKKKVIEGWYRVNGENLQKKGQDTIIITNLNNKIVIDEKATLNYINKNIPTFAFEVQNTKSQKMGWLFDEKLSTNYYLLGWPEGLENPNNIDDFIASSVIIIERKTILNFLSDLGITYEKCIELSRGLNKNNNSIKIGEGIKLMLTTTLYERPLNLVISREILEKMCLLSVKTTKEYVDIFNCPLCGAELIVKNGKNGEFLGCSNFSEMSCKGNLSLEKLKRKFN